MKVASFFAGVGGIDLGFIQNGFEIVYANEIDPIAVKTYEANSDIKVDNRDINIVKSEEIPDFDVMVAGFPCQAFSIAGERQGFNDEKGRGILFFELERIFNEKEPSIVFLENVKNLTTHDNGRTFKVILERLETAGYHVSYKVLNTMEYGNVPQNRERIYIVAFKDAEINKNFVFPGTQVLTNKLEDVIDFSTEIDAKYYYTKEKYPAYFNTGEDMPGRKTLLNLADEITEKNQIYQIRRGKYVRQNKKNVCPTLTANMGTGGHNVPLILTDHGIRKLTPKECFNLQGFPEDFILPADIKDSYLYKQSGNSVSVPVIKEIANQIRIAIEQKETH
jgi:DNA (cytosine-5)-methyltransferase 1